MILDQIKVNGLHVPAGFSQLCPDFRVLRLIVCRKGVIDPKTPADRGTKKRIRFLSNTEEIQNNSDNSEGI